MIQKPRKDCERPMKNQFLPTECKFSANDWHFGTDLPYVIYGGATVQLNNTFLIVGGFNGTYLDTIWTFDVVAEGWTLLNEHLTIGREFTAAFLVPDDFC